MSICDLHINRLMLGDIQAVLTLVISFITLFGLLIGIGFAIWQFRLYKKLAGSEQAIRAKQTELDNVEPSVNART